MRLLVCGWEVVFVLDSVCAWLAWCFGVLMWLVFCGFVLGLFGLFLFVLWVYGFGYLKCLFVMLRCC